MNANRMNAVVVGVMTANLPIIPQEMVFAVWLIAKGVDSSVAASEAA